MGYELTSDAKKLLESLAGLGEAQAPAPLAPSAIEDLRELSRMTEMVIAEMRSMVSQRLAGTYMVAYGLLKHRREALVQAGVAKLESISGIGCELPAEAKLVLQENLALLVGEAPPGQVEEAPLALVRVAIPGQVEERVAPPGQVKEAPLALVRVAPRGVRVARHDLPRAIRVAQAAQAPPQERAQADVEADVDRALALFPGGGRVWTTDRQRAFTRAKFSLPIGMRTAGGIWNRLAATGNTHGLSATQVHDHLKRMMKIEKAAEEGDEVEAQEGQVEAQEGQVEAQEGDEV